MGKTLADESKSRDNRVIHRAVRMPGFRDELSGLYQAGEIVDTVSRLQELIVDGKMDVQKLKAQAVISGDWTGLNAPTN
jgi:hypothetical protein